VILIWILGVVILLTVALDQLVERMYRNERKPAQITPQNSFTEERT
jgi:hypothetical protein